MVGERDEGSQGQATGSCTQEWMISMLQSDPRPNGMSHSFPTLTHTQALTASAVCSKRDQGHFRVRLDPGDAMTLFFLFLECNYGDGHTFSAQTLQRQQINGTDNSIMECAMRSENGNSLELIWHKPCLKFSV